MSAVNPDHWAGCDCSQCMFDVAVASNKTASTAKRDTPAAMPPERAPVLAVDKGRSPDFSVDPVSSDTATACVAPPARAGAGEPEKTFPIQDHAPRHIPWWLAEEAYAVYSSRYGTSQSLERLAERGGFGASELDEFIPGWRDRIDRVKQLEATVATLEARLRDALSAHGNSFGALAMISAMTALGGEVDDYGAVVEAVEARLRDAERLIGVIVHQSGGTLRLTAHAMMTADLTALHRTDDAETGDVIFSARDST